MRQRIFSGVQPSGSLHLGNYLGALRNWVELQNEYECFFCVVDYHAITVRQNPDELRQKITEIAKLYLASGINPETAVIFQQSQVGAHTELAWILNTITRMPELERMTQYKDKSASAEKEGVGVGLFDYPVLMAADILLYNTDLVPVGEDQTQHLELTKTLAERFNRQFGNGFSLKAPTPFIQKAGARIMGLDDPNKKMSKSAGSAYNYIALLDSPAEARKKIMKAVTDTDGEVRLDPEAKPAIANLLTIYSLLANVGVQELETQYAGKGYGDFKKDLADVVERFLADFQSKYSGFEDSFIEEHMARGAKRAQEIANETLEAVRQAIGVR